MKIVSVETFLVAPRWLFCRLATDEGIVGWGECTLEGRAETVRAAVHSCEEILLGADPLRVGDLWQVLSKSTFYRFGEVLASAVAGIDQALWDITGKFFGAPVHQLLGGRVRDRVRVYGWVGGDEPAELGDAVAAAVAAGLTAVKVNGTPRVGPVLTSADIARSVARAEAARTVLGPDRDLAVDLHGRVSPTSAPRLIEALADVAPLFVEEPVLPEYVATVVPSLVQRTTTPIALGERLFHRSMFLGPLTDGVAVVQPDVAHAGGLSETLRIATLAETFGAHVAPHSPIGPIALAACLQVDLVAPNFLIQEQSLGIHYNEGADLLDYLLDPAVFAMTDGHIEAPVGPGLGITVDEAAVRAADRVGHAWRSPIWRQPDGAFAEW